MTSVLGIKMTHVPVLSIIVMILIVTMQLVNKFLFIDKEKDNILRTLIKKQPELALTMPFLQAGAIDMYAEKLSTYQIIMLVGVYYFTLLVGLMLTETIFGGYNMLLLLLVGVGINFVTPIMGNLICLKHRVSCVAMMDRLCCGQPLTWYYIGIIASILFNYHFLSNKKVSTSLFIIMYFVLGLLLAFGQFKFLENQGDNSAECVTFIFNLVPYLLGGAFTFGSLGLLFTKF
jgi:hypothetical protein